MENVFRELHPEADRGTLSLVIVIALRTGTDFATDRSTLFQLHAILLVMSNALCLLSGGVIDTSEIKELRHTLAFVPL